MKNWKLIIAFIVGFGAAFTWAHYARMPKYDLNLPDQDVRTYTDNNPVSQLPQTFQDKFFEPWTKTELPDIKSVFEIALNMQNKKYYNGMGKKYSSEYINKIIENTNPSATFTPRRAVMVADANMRAVPTDEMIYDKPSHPTFGYPFDQTIYSRIRMNTPVVIMHESLDARFYAIHTFHGGVFWVPADTVRTISDADIKTFMNTKFITPIMEPLFLPDGTHVHIGTLFPIINNQTVRAGTHGWEPVILQSNMIAPWPMKFSHDAVAKLGQAMHSPYAWGGIDGYGRDCSQLMQEMYMPFGLYLPRNSRTQANYLKSIDLAGLKSSEKEKIIASESVPFETLLYFPGHIMLYIGNDDMGKPLVFHNVWGIRQYTQFLQETRQVIGRTVVSDLDIGKTWTKRMDKVLFIRETAD